MSASALTFSLAPLQGYTDAAFRQALHHIAGGIDKFYTPYLRYQNDGKLKPKDIRDVLPENNKGIPLIPQILTREVNEFLALDQFLFERGYTELNWNLGCPYPMVAKRGLGSGLLPHATEIRQILEGVFPQLRCKLSIKLRLGYEDPDDILSVVEVLNDYSLEEVILHPRIGKDLYKKEARLSSFKTVQEKSKHPLAYNGDVLHVEDVKRLQNELPESRHIMIGRGLLRNPFLVWEYRNHVLSDALRREKLAAFYNTLFEHYVEVLSGESHQLNKLLHLWEYLSYSFANQRKCYKELKKSKKLSIFHATAQRIIHDAAFVNASW